MLNLDETVFLQNKYIVQKDLFVRMVLYATGVVTFIDIVRAQVSEIDLIQLIPGFYLLVLFVSFIFLVYFSNLFLRSPFLNDNNKGLGTKTIPKLEFSVKRRVSLYFFMTGSYIVLNTIIPLSLDAFESYGGKELQSLWSFDQVITLEIILLSTLILICQTPIFIIAFFNNEKNLSKLPKYWKTVSFGIFLAAGILTPTIDGNTQLGFACAAVALYIMIISILVKRVNVKFNATLTLSS